MYKTMIRSKIDYDCIVYNSTSTHIKSKLDPIQKSCLQIILRAFPTSPIHSLQALPGIPPLAVRRSILSTNHALNALSKRPHTCNTATHLKLLQTVATGNHLLFLSTIQVNQFTWQSSLESRSFQQAIDFDALVSHYPDWTFCFTDGSKTAERAGGAFMIDTSLQNFNLPQTTSPLTSEQMAIYQCLLNLPTPGQRKFIICTDSQLCLQRLTNLKTTCILTSHILYTIHNLSSPDVQLCFTWIP